MVNVVCQPDWVMGAQISIILGVSVKVFTDEISR